VIASSTVRPLPGELEDEAVPARLDVKEAVEVEETVDSVYRGGQSPRQGWEAIGEDEEGFSVEEDDEEGVNGEAMG